MVSYNLHSIYFYCTNQGENNVSSLSKDNIINSIIPDGYIFELIFKAFF